MKDNTKVTTKAYAVLTKNFTYTAHNGITSNGGTLNIIR